MEDEPNKVIKKAKVETKSTATRIELLDAGNIVQELFSLKGGCFQMATEYSNCILSKFLLPNSSEPDINSAVNFIKGFRTHTYCLSKEDLTQFMDRRYRESLQNGLSELQSKH